MPGKQKKRRDRPAVRQLIRCTIGPSGIGRSTTRSPGFVCGAQRICPRNPRRLLAGAPPPCLRDHVPGWFRVGGSCGRSPHPPEGRQQYEVRWARARARFMSAPSPCRGAGQRSPTLRRAWLGAARRCLELSPLVSPVAGAFTRLVTDRALKRDAHARGRPRGTRILGLDSAARCRTRGISAALHRRSTHPWLDRRAPRLGSG